MPGNRRRSAIKGFGDKTKQSVEFNSRSDFLNPSLEFLDDRYVASEDMSLYALLSGCTFTGEVVFSEAAIIPEGTEPTGKTDGYISVVDDVLYYFAGGHRYKLTATLDDPI